MGRELHIRKSGKPPWDYSHFNNEEIACLEQNRNILKEVL